MDAAEKVKIKQVLKPLDEAALDGARCAVLLLGPDATSGYPFEALLKQRLKDKGKTKLGNGVMTLDVPTKAYTRLTVARVSTSSSTYDLLTLCRKLIAPLLDLKPADIAVGLYGMDAALARRVAETLQAALFAAVFALPTYKKEKPSPPPLKSLTLYGLELRLDFSRVRAEASGNNLARELTSLPPNYLTPEHYRRRIAELAKQRGWRYRFLDRKALEKLGAGAFLAVAQGHPSGQAGIVHLQYRPGKRQIKRPDLALVGKGVCFDTGGNNLKPAKSMHGMHEDMEGSAVALGTLLALTELKSNFAVDAWLALSENMIGPLAYKQNDVVTALDGTTIEIVHTDAEGRMLLADTLALAARDKPRLIVDYATLTGACVYALGTRYSGVFTNRLALLDDVVIAGRDSGERVWPFPMDEDYDDELDSKVADIKQCTLGGEADHILAARFLKRFVADTPWLHVDLSAGNNKGGLAHIPSDITGFGVRFTLELLLSRQVLRKLA